MSFLRLNSEIIIYANLLIMLFNLIPIYPLDGGRIIKGILHIFYGRRESYDYSNKISNISIVLLTILSSIAILYLKNIAILFILAYLWYLVILENKKYQNKKKLYENMKKIKEKQIVAAN